MTRVLHVSQPTEAGVANVVLSLIADQVSRGWDVHVAAPLDGYLLRAARDSGATVHPWTAARTPGATVPSETTALARILAQVSPDVVHLHSAKAGLAGRLTLRGRTPTLFQPHAWSYEAATGPIRVASQLWESWAARWTTLTVCVSEAERALGQQYRSLAKEVLVAPNGVDTSVWTPQDKRSRRAQLGLDLATPTVVCVGRLCRQKGQDVLLEAWPRVREAVPDAVLHLVGDGPDRAILEAQATPGVEFHGRAAPLPWFGAADVAVVPSRWEGMPLVVLEAMACALPVVATHVNGVSEALGQVELCPAGDPDSLVHQLVGRLTTPEAARAEGEVNRSRVATEWDVRRTTGLIADATHRLTHPS